MAPSRFVLLGKWFPVFAMMFFPLARSLANCVGRARCASEMSSAGIGLSVTVTVADICP